MHPLRSDLLAAAHSLIALSIRLQEVTASKGRPYGDQGALGELQPPSGWLDARVPNTAIGGAQVAIRYAVAALLDLIRAEGDLDPRKGAWAMHIASGDSIHFSSRVRAFAKRYGVELPEYTRDELGFRDYSDRVYQRYDLRPGVGST